MNPSDAPRRPAGAALPDPAHALSAHRPYLVRYATRQLRDAALVEDVVQETLLAALQPSAAFERRASLRTWLTAILLRRIADAVRRQARRERGRPNDWPSGDASEGDTPDGDARAGPAGEPIDWVDPQRRLEGRQFIDALGRCLALLPPTSARLFTLREIDGLSNEEAASALGLDPRQAPVILHRARHRLRAGLASHGARTLHA